MAFSSMWWTYARIPGKYTEREREIVFLFYFVSATTILLFIMATVCLVGGRDSVNGGMRSLSGVSQPTALGPVLVTGGLS